MFFVFFYFSNSLKKVLTLLCFSLKYSSLVKDDTVDHKDVLILNGNSLDGCMISTICSLVIEDIDDSMDELIYIGNDGNCFSLYWFC